MPWAAFLFSYSISCFGPNCLLLRLQLSCGLYNAQNTEEVEKIPSKVLAGAALEGYPAAPDALED